MSDDFSEDISTKATLQPGVGLAAGFQHGDDIDWFRFHAEAGQSIDFSTVLPITGRTDDFIEVYNAQGESMPVHFRGPFNVGTTGDYYLAVRADGRVGSYTQTMMVLEDDYSWNLARPGILSAGSEITGEIQFVRDVDRISLKVEAGYFYTFNISGQAPWNGLYHALQDSSGNEVTTFTQSVSNGTRTALFYADKSDTYSFELGNHSNANFYGNYTLKLNVLTADDFGGVGGNAQPLALGQTLNGKLDVAGDVDVFRVDLKAGVTYQFQTLVELGGFALPMLWDSGLRNVLSYATSNDFTFTPLADGAYYLAQSNYGRTQSKSTAYSVRYSTTQDDYGANAASAGTLTPGTEVSGVLEQGGADVDWHAVKLEAGGLYTMTLKRDSNGQGGVALRLLDADGNTVATGNSTATDGLLALSFKAPVAATYYAEVAASNSVGGYRLNANFHGLDDHGNDSSQATVIREDVALSGKLEIAADRDAFKFSASANTLYAVDVIPTGAGASSFKKNAAVKIYSGVGDMSQVSSGDTLSKVFVTYDAHDYYFIVDSLYDRTPGDYTIKVRNVGVDDYASSSLTTGQLSTNTPARGRIDIGNDSDWFKVHLEANRWYTFELHGAKSGGGTLTSSLSSTQIKLVDQQGAAAGTGDDYRGGEPRFYTSVETAGDYFLAVNGGSDATGSYTIVATDITNDVTRPQLLSSSIQSGAVNVSTMPRIVLTFDEAMQTGGRITLTDSNGVAVNPSSGQLLAAAYGKTMVIDPHMHLKPGMTYTLSLPDGSLADLMGNSFAGALNYSFTVTAPVSQGTAGNDYLIGTGRGAVLDGGAGTDTVYYGTSGFTHQVMRNSDGTVNVAAVQGGLSDTLTGVERLLFTDGARALDIDGVGGQAYRLYQAAFDRQPDSAGLGFWMAYMDGGMDLQTVAGHFIQSDEFSRLYGTNASDAEFVRLLYNNVLHREPEDAGNSFWINILANGATRASVLMNFSESAENIAAMAPIIGNGFAYTPYG